MVGKFGGLVFWGIGLLFVGVVGCKGEGASPNDDGPGGQAGDGDAGDGDGDGDTGDGDGDGDTGDGDGDGDTGDGDTGDGDGDGDTGDGDGDGDSGESSKTIGPDGGSVVSEDGKLTLTIPKGALESSQKIQVLRGSSQDPPLFGDAEEIEVSDVYELLPHGLQFEKPVAFELELEHPVTDELGHFSTESRRIWHESDDLLRVLDTQIESTAEDDEAVFRGSIEHFSWMIVEGFGNRRFGAGFSVEVNYPSKICVGDEGDLELTLRSHSNRIDLPFPQRTHSFPDFPLPLLLDPGADPEGDPVFSEELPRALDGEEDTVDAAFRLACDAAGSVFLYYQLIVPTVALEDGEEVDRWEQKIYIPVRLDCEVCEQDDEFPEGAIESLAGIESVFRLPKDFAELEGPHVLAAGEGTVVHDKMGNVIFDMEAEGDKLYRAEGIVWDLMSGPAFSIFGVGPAGLFDRSYRPDQKMFNAFAQLGASNNNVSSFHKEPSETDPTLTRSVVVVNNSLGSAFRFYPESGLEEEPFLSAQELAVAGIPGALVDLMPISMPEGYFGTTDQQPFLVFGSDIAKVGELDEMGGYRLVDCSGKLCGVSNFIRKELSSFYLDTSGDVIEPLDVQDVDGPVGVDVEGDAIVAAGYHDHQLYKIDRSLDEETKVSTLDVSEDCLNPSAPQFVLLQRGGFQIVTNCYGNARILFTEVDAF